MKWGSDDGVGRESARAVHCIIQRKSGSRVRSTHLRRTSAHDEIFMFSTSWKASYTPCVRKIKVQSIIQTWRRTGALLSGILLAAPTAGVQAEPPAADPDLQVFIEKVNAQLLRLRWTGSGPTTLQQKQRLNTNAWTDVLTTR